MQSYTRRDVIRAVALAMVLTAIGVIALLDPSCRRTGEPDPGPPSRAVAP